MRQEDDKGGPQDTGKAQEPEGSAEKAVTGNESLVTAVELAALGVGGWLIAAAAEVKEA